MTVRKLRLSDFTALDHAGGYVKKIGENMKNWLERNYITSENSFVFSDGDVPVGGVCFAEVAPNQWNILDFALREDLIPSGSDLLAESMRLSVLEQQQVSYDLYNDTPLYHDLQELFLRAGFLLVQEKKRYSYENTVSKQEALHKYKDLLSFRSVTEIGEDAFTNLVGTVTKGTLDSGLAQDFAENGQKMCAFTYVELCKLIDFNPDWWKVAYAKEKPVGLILPQNAGEDIGLINYVGVVPDMRGNGYVNALLAEGTRILCENGISKIFADIDVLNFPLEQALETVAYQVVNEESVLEYSNEKNL
ncbi:hypothetical protein FACS1894111_06340 [Clostridia bacterium]|nr:hypothetical protein FACS1894111_06340 [Clostridia bacterium]